MAFDNNVLAPNKASVNMGTHLFYLRDDQYEARQTATKADKVFEALGLVREMTPRDKMAFAFFSNQPARTMSEELIDAFVKDLAMRNPDQVIRSMSAGDWKTRAFIHRAIHYGLMTADGGVHKVGADVIGIDEDSAVHFVMDQANRELMNQLQQRMKDEQAREAGLHA
jgi:hypothetical protein